MLAGRRQQHAGGEDVSRASAIQAMFWMVRLNTRAGAEEGQGRSCQQSSERRLRSEACAHDCTSHLPVEVRCA